MVPASPSHPTNYTSQPILKPSTETLWWREVVKKWTETVITAMDAGYTRAIGIAETIGLVLYRSLEEIEKEKVIRNIKTGEIILCPKT